MNKISSLSSLYDIKVLKYVYKNSVLILDTDKGKYVIKEKKSNRKKEIYDYLLSRGFPFFLYPESYINDKYEVYPYINEVSTLKEEKAVHLINVLSELQIRTTTYKEYTLDEIKELYEEKNKQINTLINYYNDLEEAFSTKVYPSSYERLYLVNASKVYNTLLYSKELVEKWYLSVIQNKKKRLVLLHNHLSLDHFLDCKDAKIINFDYASYGSPVYDFSYFYKKHYYELDMFSLFKIYQHRYTYTYEEMLLLFIQIIIPIKVKLTNNNLENTLAFHKLISYIDITRDFILKQQEKQKKENNDKLSK